MNLESLSFALSQISYLIASLTKKNYKSSTSECLSLISTFGPEAERHLFRCLFSRVDFSLENKPPISQELQFLISKVDDLLSSQSHFVSVLCFSLDNPLHHQKTLRPSPDLLSNLSLNLRLSPIKDILFSLALTHSSILEIKALAQSFFIKKFSEYANNNLASDSKVDNDTDINSLSEGINYILTTIYENEDYKALRVDGSLDKFINYLNQEYCSSDAEAPTALLPFLDLNHQDPDPSLLAAAISEITMASKGLLDGSIPDVIRELGYQFTSNSEHCRDMLQKLCRGQEIHAQMVARIIGVMVRTHSGLDEGVNTSSNANNIWDKDKGAGEPTSWNMDVFIKVVNELQPTLHWKEIIYELDHPGFLVPDRQGLMLLIKALRLGLQAQGFQGPFPFEMFYRHWKNTEGQVSLFQHCLQNPEIFSLADHHHHSAAFEVLKVPPDLQSREVSSWVSLELVDALLYLAEHGQSHIVTELFKFPQTHCPDVLALSLLQLNTPITPLRRDLLTVLFQIFLANHPNSLVILAHAWNMPAFKVIVIQAMDEYYRKAAEEGDCEHSRLSRILDVAQDLKALSVMLNAQPIPFIIDLAVLASRREYLKLEKWLTDQMMDHGEASVKAVVQYLQRKIPAIMGSVPVKEEYVLKSNIPLDALPIILMCLQQIITNGARIQMDLRETIITMVSNCQGILSRRQSQQQPPVPPPVVLRPPSRSTLESSGTGGFGSGNSTLNNTTSSNGCPIRTTPRLPSNSMFPVHDPIAGISSQFPGGLNLNAPTSSSAISLGPLVSGPGSPSRIFGNPTTSVESSSQFGGIMPQPPPHHHISATVSNSTTAVGTTGAGTSMPSGMQSGIEQLRQGNIANLLPDMCGPVSKEIEDETNSYFQRIYNRPPYPTLSIDEVLDLLKKFQDSPNQRERSLFNCMIKNLFEEYQFFYQYPDAELHITSQLFGGIIERGLVPTIPLGIALRYVLEALRKRLDSNLYIFGITALDRFKTRLKDYPQYCQHISCIPHFKDFPPHLIEWVEFGSQSLVPPGEPQAPDGSFRPSSQRRSTEIETLPTQTTTLQVAKTTVTVTSTTSSSTTIVRPSISTVGGRPSIANTTNIDTLINARQATGHSELVVPSVDIQDKIAFIFNNLSLMNMQQKAADLREQLKDDIYTVWLAQYLVMKRASIEPNFHNVYSSFLEVLCMNSLYDDVIIETYHNIRILLRSDKVQFSCSDRTLLKNLGHWLGLMTLARNRPILTIELDTKPLIIEAYHNGQHELFYIVPFIAKVMESCARSRVFKPPCPWTMGIMNLLAELHQEHDLKLNLKFEIEVLCKTLNLDLNTLSPGNLLKDYDRLHKILNVKNFSLQHHQTSIQSHHPVALAKPGGAEPSFVMPTGHKLEHGGVMHGGNVTSSSNIGAFNTPVTSVQPGSAGAGMGAALVATPIISLTGSAALMGGMGMQGQNPRLYDTSHPESLAGPPQTNEPMTPPVIQQQPASSNNTVTPATLVRQSEPKFHFTDINTSNLNGIVPHISIDSRLTLLRDQPDLVQLIKLAIEKSIQEWASPVIDRAIKIALTTCEQIVKKDCALDHDENRLRHSAHYMVRNLTAGMAMITCRDHLLLSIKTHLKNFMITLGRNLTPNQTEAIEMTVSVIANDNVELACAFIQKKAIEKAIPEIDKRLKGEYDNRILARKEGRRHWDGAALAYQAERMPEMIRLKVGAVSQQQNAVYEEFAHNIPGFKPLTDREILAIAPKPLVDPGPVVLSSSSNTMAPSEDCIAILDEVFSKLEPFVANCTGLPTTPHMANLHALVQNLAVTRSSKEVNTISLLIHKAVEGLLEGLTPNLPVETENLARYRDANLLVLRALSDPRAFGANWTSRQVTLALIEAREELKYNLDAVDILIRSGFVSLLDYDKHLSQAMQGGENVIATAFAMHLCKIYLIDDRSNAHIIESDLFGTIETLQKISTNSPRPPDGIISLMEMIKMSSERLEQNLAMAGPTGQLHSGIQQAREFGDPRGLLEKTEFLLREWVNAYHSRDAGKDSRQAFFIFVKRMNEHGILKTDDLITRFFRMSTQMCVDLCYRALAEQNNSPTLVRAKCFHTLDAYVRLITLLVKHSGETQNTVTKVNLLNKVLGIVAGVLLIDHDVRNTGFQQVPYHRIFIMLFLELNTPDHILATINFQVLMAYSNMLHLLRPAKAPGFAYAWLEIVSHRVFMQQVLVNSPQAKSWPMYAQLLADLFKFLAPFLRNAELAKPVHRLFRGTQRVLLVLLHDFPDFLSDYHYTFCDVIPPNCIQMRNLILSAFPRSMRLPDPFMPNLKVDMLPEISIAPRMCANYSAMLKPSFKKELDSYLKNRGPVSFLVEVRSHLVINGSGGESGGNGTNCSNRYNIQMINALVMHVGISAINYIRSKQLAPNMATIAHSSHMDIFQNLAVDLETEGRYLFLNCIANQLRYPNSHTHYFSCTLLYLFAEANTQAIQEQITRVLLERLIVNRPHPWGLLITFIELIKNPTYKFWTHDFVHCAPEIRKLFESVARSCMVPSLPRDNGDNE
uniref:CCR4-NOT transcription complex subunit 1 n=1 Tax=Lepeophtheirus salmonis TaxID=72036 RepID=A0A0K2T7H7_LEPSM